MKATGIVRRIDDLGRVVIPKEIRRTMRIREGDPLEIYTDREGEVIFKKYSPIGELAAFASQYAETLHKTCGLSVAICDRDAVIACAGLPRKEYTDKALSDELEALMESRNLYVYRPTGSDLGQDMADRKPVIRDSNTHYVSCAMPILSEGDIVGCVVSVRSDAPDAPDDGNRLNADIESKLILTAAGFLGRQLES